MKVWRTVSYTIVAATLSIFNARATPASAPADFVRRAKDHAALGQQARALEILRSGIASLEADPAGAPPETLADATLLLSVTLFRKGLQDEGQRALEVFVRLRPDVTLAREDYPPLFLKLWSRALKKAQRQGTAEMLIEADAPGAVVNLDGRPLGPPPVLVTRVLPGEHHVFVVRGDARAVSASPGERVAVRFGAPAGSPGRVRRVDFLLAAPDDAAPEDEMPLAAPSHRPPLGTAAPLNTPPLNTRPDVTRAVNTTLAEGGLAAPAPSERAALSPPLYKQWWFWTVIGAAAVGTSAAVGAWAASKTERIAIDARWQ